MDNIKKNYDFGSSQKITLTPVGVVVSKIKNPSLKTNKNGLQAESSNGKEHSEKRKRPKDLESELHIAPQYSPLLDGVEDFSHLLVLYWPHLIDLERRTLQKVHPMGRSKIPKQGIFATCSPARPNPVLVTACKLIKRQNNILVVQGLEAVNGSPIIDIKIYNPQYYRPDNVHVASWMKEIFAENDNP